MARNPGIDEPARRRALRQALRGVARLLRTAGLVLALVGAAGLAAGGPGAWWIVPSWFSLALGWALILAGIVRRVHNRRRRGDGVPGS